LSPYGWECYCIVEHQLLKKGRWKEKDRWQVLCKDERIIIKTQKKEEARKCMNWIHVAQDRDKLVVSC